MNSCAGCHNKPIIGGGGEFGTLVFVLGQRFDFSTFDHSDTIHTRDAVDEGGDFISEQAIANGSPAFFAGNGMFLTRKLWGIANQHPFMHHGQFTTMRQAVLAHAGEALTSRTAFQALASYDQNSIVEFLKSLQIFTNQVGSLCEDENGEGIDCPAGIDL